MFTKTLSALAIILSTVSSAVAATKHEGMAANHEPAIKASGQNPRDKADFVIGNMLFVGFHEMGDAIATFRLRREESCWAIVPRAVILR